MQTYIPPYAGRAAEIEPHRMVFPNSLLQTMSYFDPQPANLIDIAETFGSTAPFTTFPLTGTGTGSFSVASNEGQISAGANQSLVAVETANSLSMPQFFISVQIDSVGANTGAYRDAGVGFFKDGSNSLLAVYDFSTNHVNYGIVLGNTFTQYGTFLITLTPPFSLGVSLIGNSVTVWYNSGSGWTSLGSHTISQTDFTILSNLSGYKGGIRVDNVSGSWNAKFSNLKIGRFGGVYMRDQCIVHDQAGNPYVDNIGNVYFLANAGDPQGAGYCGIFALNPTVPSIVQTGVLMFSRSGHVYPDAAGDLIRFSDTHFKIFMSSWGTGVISGGPATFIESADITPSSTILNGNSVIAVSAVSLPSPLGYALYDPSVIFDGTTWWMAYTTANNGFTQFYPCLASSPDLTTWTLVGSDASVGSQKFEGTRLIKANRTAAGVQKYWILAGGPNACSSCSARIYDQAMNFIGTLSATFTGSPANRNSPHPMVFAYGDRVYVITFNGTLFGAVQGTMGQPTLQRGARYW